MNVTLYGLKNCDTCRKALKEIEGDGHNVTLIDVREDGMDPCLLYTSPSPRDATLSRMPSSA